MSFISSLEDQEVDALREYLLGDFYQFSKFCFKLQTGTELLYVDYYEVLFEFLQHCIDQKMNRVIINIPPRAGKTQIVSIFLPLFAWCRNPSGKSILTGFNSDVLHECTGFIRDIMTDPDFERVFPDVRLNKNKKSVEHLGTLSAGSIFAVVPTGKVTGKGAGRMVKDFAGIFCIDDYCKPDDVLSPVEREKGNNRFSNVLLSRLETEDTPLVIIMQRLGEEDLCGFLMKGGTSDVYDWLNVPGIITPETGSEEWYQDQIDRFGYTNVRPYLYDLKRPPEAYDNGESSFWDRRKTLESLRGMREFDQYTFNSQYMGMPASKGNTALDAQDINTYLRSEFDPRTLKHSFVTADTADTVESYSDFSVACHWGVTKDDRLYLLDLIVGKWETPDLIVEMRNFWKKLYVFDRDAPRLKPRKFYMEDKSSGRYLNQQFTRDGTVKITPVPRDGTAGKDKFTRFLNAVPYFEQGKIYLPKDHEHFQHCFRELLGQSDLGNSTGHDDFVDNVSDAVVVAFSARRMSYESWV